METKVYSLPSLNYANDTVLLNNVKKLVFFFLRKR